jgi:hypothetical protein
LNASKVISLRGVVLGQTAERENAFALQTQAGTFLLQAQDDVSRRSWIAALRDAINALSGTDSSGHPSQSSPRKGGSEIVGRSGSVFSVSPPGQPALPWSGSVASSATLGRLQALLAQLGSLSAEVASRLVAQSEQAAQLEGALADAALHLEEARRTLSDVLAGRREWQPSVSLSLSTGSLPPYRASEGWSSARPSFRGATASHRATPPRAAMPTAEPAQAQERASGQQAQQCTSSKQAQECAPSEEPARRAPSRMTLALSSLEAMLAREPSSASTSTSTSSTTVSSSLQETMSLIDQLIAAPAPVPLSRSTSAGDYGPVSKSALNPSHFSPASSLPAPASSPARHLNDVFSELEED